MPCMKRVYKDKMRGFIVRQLGTKRASRNRWSTADFIPLSVYTGFRLFVLLVFQHALHEKGLQRQMGVVPLFGSQEQSALLVPLINR